MGRERPAGRGAGGQAGRPRGHVDGARREPGWARARVRPARRPVSPADRGRRGAGADAGDGLGHAAALQPGRAVDRVHQRPRRRRQRVGARAADGCGGGGGGAEARAQASHEGGLPAGEQPGVVARRELHRGAQALHQAPLPRHGRDLAVPRGGRQGRADDGEGQRPEGCRRAGVLAGRGPSLLQPRQHAGGDLRVQQGPVRRDLRDQAAGAGQRAHRDAGRRSRGRGPADAVAGRQVARVHPSRRRVRGAPDAVR